MNNTVQFVLAGSAEKIIAFFMNRGLISEGLVYQSGSLRYLFRKTLQYSG